MQLLGLTINEWLDLYRKDQLDPEILLTQVRNSIVAHDNAFISVCTLDQIAEQIRALKLLPQACSLPLYGVPFVVKDNIDVVGLPTTAACPEFSYLPKEDAFTVSCLKAAGAIVIGKTNLDQFATGLVGTRSPYGAVPNSFSPEYISGGSSSGSATLVARGLVPFSLGTDTAGSGRVPAGFNNLVGLKPTKGRFSSRGVVPACRSLDCVSIFALTVEDAEIVADILTQYDEADAYSREPIYFPAGLSAKPVFAIPSNLKWFERDEYAIAWDKTLEQLSNLGVEIKPIDFSPMYELASLLYGGSWVAERHAAIAKFMEKNADKINPVVCEIIQKATSYSATDAYQNEYQRMALARSIQTLMTDVDALLVPTAPYHPTLNEVAAEPFAVNSHLGTYTNFVNLADCSALALPANFCDNGLPFGITLIAPAWKDKALAAFGKIWQKSQALPLGANLRVYPSSVNQITTANVPAGYVRVAVVGAHLTGMPLNIQLQERNAIFVEETKTSADYQLFALPNTTPPKPGLKRVPHGQSIVVELWDVPTDSFGSFVALIPSPLGIGTLTLVDGREVKGFICEGFALEGATNITEFGGWRAYIASLKKN